jgi:hypothetical protein
VDHDPGAIRAEVAAIVAAAAVQRVRIAEDDLIDPNNLSTLVPVSVQSTAKSAGETKQVEGLIGPAPPTAAKPAAFRSQIATLPSGAAVSASAPPPATIVAPIIFAQTAIAPTGEKLMSAAAATNPDAKSCGVCTECHMAKPVSEFVMSNSSCNACYWVGHLFGQIITKKMRKMYFKRIKTMHCFLCRQTKLASQFKRAYSCIDCS